MLQDSSPPKWTKVFVSNTGTSRIINNTFYGTDGMALEYNGVDNLVENNLFEFNDWTGNNMDVATGGNPSFLIQLDQPVICALWWLSCPKEGGSLGNSCCRCATRFAKS